MHNHLYVVRRFYFSIFIFSVFFSKAQWYPLPAALSAFTGTNNCYSSMTLPAFLLPVADKKILYTTDCQTTPTLGSIYVQLTTTDMLSATTNYTFSGNNIGPFSHLCSYKDSAYAGIYVQGNTNTCVFSKNNFASVVTVTIPAGSFVCRGSAISPNFIYTLYQNGGSDSMHIYRANWSGATYPSTGNFNYDVWTDKMHFINDSTGYVTAFFKSSSGITALLRTTNYGVTWTPILTDSTAYPIFEYSVLPGGRIYVSKTNGGVYTSANNGITWTQPTASLPGGGRCIAFMNDSCGYIGGAGTVYKTTDRGLIWTLDWNNPNITLDYLYVFGNSAYFVTSNKDVYKNNMVTNVNDNLLHPTQFVLYPNPGAGRFTVHADQLNEHTLIIVYNTAAQEVLSLEPGSTTFDIDISNQPNGVYIVKLGNAYKKLVKH